MSYTTRLILSLAAAMVLGPSLALPASGHHASSFQTDQENERDLERRVRDMDKLINSRRYPARRGPRRSSLAARIKEDFTRLSVINNELSQVVSENGPLDLKFIAKSCSEIKKRTKRLMDNLALPDPEKGPNRPKLATVLEPEQLKSSLAALGQLLGELANNPFFKDKKVVNAQLAAKAREDLEGIVELSDRIKRSSERMSKATQQAPLTTHTLKAHYSVNPCHN